MHRLAALAVALLIPVSAAGATDAPQPDSFTGLWTSWSSASREATAKEKEAERRVRDDLAQADAVRLAALRDQGRALGERVGEIVRLGDCAEGERVAREAGDFALVAAVQAHCRVTAAAAR